MYRPKVWKYISEMSIVPTWGPWTWGGLRSRFKVMGSRFFGVTPAYDNTIINYELARQLYRNDGTNYDLGYGFCRPIVDLTVNFMGTPTATTGDPLLDDFLNTCVREYWGDELTQTFRNAIRDSKTIVRIRQHDIFDPLMSMQERGYPCLEVVDPERVIIVRDPLNAEIIDKAYITKHVIFVDDPGDIENGILPKEREHEIIEIITRERFQYYDKTERKFLYSLNSPNNWNFVPLVEVWNEYDSSLSGGQSDLESVYPFVRAFHDVTLQGLQAHKYHSIPKVKFKLKEVATFISNNFPEAWDDSTQKLKEGATITWQGHEMVFLQDEEDAGFIEAKSVLGDTKALAEFLIDCIAVASQTPRWAFMLVDSGSANQANNAQVVPFGKKIDRKRKSFQKSLQRIMKMVMVVAGYEPISPAISWNAQRAELQAADAQALQQKVMALEVMAQRRIISDPTYREEIRPFLPTMQNPQDEAKMAETNFDPNPAPVTSAPADGPGAKNGKGNPKNVPVGG